MPSSISPDGWTDTEVFLGTSTNQQRKIHTAKSALITADKSALIKAEKSTLITAEKSALVSLFAIAITRYEKMVIWKKMKKKV